MKHSYKVGDQVMVSWDSFRPPTRTEIQVVMSHVDGGYVVNPQVDGCCYWNEDVMRLAPPQCEFRAWFGTRCTLHQGHESEQPHSAPIDQVYADVKDKDKPTSRDWALQALNMSDACECGSDKIKIIASVIDLAIAEAMKKRP